MRWKRHQVAQLHRKNGLENFLEMENLYGNDCSLESPSVRVVIAAHHPQKQVSQAVGESSLTLHHHQQLAGPQEMLETVAVEIAV